MMNRKELEEQKHVIYMSPGSKTKIFRANIMEITNPSLIKDGKEIAEAKISFVNNGRHEERIVNGDNLFSNVKAVELYIAIQKSPGKH
jgi:hypothetical protein